MASPGSEPEEWDIFIQWPTSPSNVNTAGDISALSRTSPLPLLAEIAANDEWAGVRLSHDSDSTVSEGTIAAQPRALPSTPLGEIRDGSTACTFSNSKASATTIVSLNDSQRSLRSVRGVKQLAHNRLLAPRPGPMPVGSPSYNDGNFIHYSPYGTVGRKPKTRSKFDDEKRKEYRQTRKSGSCARCRTRKIKCDSNIAEICARCLKTGISHELCWRTKVRDLSTHGAMGLAQAFVETYHETIETWKPDKILLDVGHGFGDAFTIEIYEYVPNRPIIDVFWKEPSGWQKLEHRPFGIMNHKHIDANALDTYVRSQVPHILYQLDRDHFRGSTIFTDTMQVVQDYLPTCADPIGRILEDALTLWGYMHLQYHALWQCADGDKTNDRLGMSELVLYSHDVQTLTPFHGTVPLPRLLHQQIHACCEGRMRELDKSILDGLEKTYTGFRARRKTAPDMFEDSSLGLYLATWLYLTILEELTWDAHRWINLLPDFNWPLKRSPIEQSEYSVHAAQTIYAHYRAAVDGNSLWAICKPKPHVLANKEEASRIPSLISRLQSSDVDVIQRRNSMYSVDIRSLELKFSAMLLEDVE